MAGPGKPGPDPRPKPPKPPPIPAKERVNIGQPPKLTPEVQAKILEGLRAGLTKKMAAHYAGVSVDCIYNWIKRGHDPNETDARYAPFAEAVHATQAKKAVDWLAKIEEAANMDWRAMAWKLERCFPEDYGKEQKVSHQFPEPLTIQLVDYRDDGDPEHSV